MADEEKEGGGRKEREGEAEKVKGEKEGEECCQHSILS